MTSFEDLTRQETHFAFGKNWASYARSTGRPEIDEAVAGLSRLLGGERLEGKRFLDIGSGSGLHALAAFELGASEVVALDINPDLVETTRAVLSLHAPGKPFEVAQASVVHDWMGGWPYESILPREVASLMSGLGFAPSREFCARGLLGGRRVGLFG